MRWVKIAELGRAGLTADQILDAITMALTELGIAQGLVVIHGDRAARVYAEHGGHIRFDDDGDPCVPIPNEAPP